MKEKTWIIGWLLIVLLMLTAAACLVYHVDPFFHFHEPNLEHYYYQLDNPRSQNDGICRHFDYNAMITGSSMTENFKTSEADRLFQKKFVKLVYTGGSFKEVNDNIVRALEYNPELKTVIRCLDIEGFFDSWDAMRHDLGVYPEYLYDENPFNDVKYLLNRDVLFGRVLPMILERGEGGFRPGITSFDDYSESQKSSTFGIGKVCPFGVDVSAPEKYEHLSEKEKEIIRKNITLNVTDTADRYSDVDFYCFYPPYSIVAWSNYYEQGLLYKELEAEAYITELIISHENIHLFSFGDRTDIITDLNHYRDIHHYASWINSLILKWIHDGTGLLTKENYRECLKREADFFTTFDYNSVAGQEDYEADYYAAALINRELTGAEPFSVTESISLTAPEQRDGGQRGFAFQADLDRGYRYLSCDVDSAAVWREITVRITGEGGRTALERTFDLSDTAELQVQHVVLDLSECNGRVTVEFLMNKAERTGREETFPITNIVLY